MAGGCLALIPARAGSKGLPGKNLRRVGGKSLVEWAVSVALQSPSVDRVVVSTDSESIAQAARRGGAQVPFIRDQHLASDTATSVEVALDAVARLELLGHSFESLVLLEPTSPLREVVDVEGTLRLMRMRRAPAAVSVVPLEQAHPEFAAFLDAANVLVPFSSDLGSGTRRQDLSPVFHMDGSVYAIEVSVLRTAKSFTPPGTVGYSLPRWKAIEVDEESDLVVVDALMNWHGHS